MKKDKELYERVEYLERNLSKLKKEFVRLADAHIVAGIDEFDVSIYDHPLLKTNVINSNGKVIIQHLTFAELADYILAEKPIERTKEIPVVIDPIRECKWKEQSPTYLEKIKKEYPDAFYDEYGYPKYFCPEDIDSNAIALCEDFDTTKELCKECWNQEVKKEKK